MITVLAVSLMATSSMALKVGARVNTIKIKDASDKTVWLPDLGKKVISIFYTDPDAKDQNEPFREMLFRANLDNAKYRGIGVVNMKDTWKPNFIIRKVIQGKIKKFKSTILTDPGHLLKDKWRLGDCDDKDVVIIVGRDKRVKYVKMGKMTATERHQATRLIKNLMQR
jgi:predicted transcriptional regulator